MNLRFASLLAIFSFVWGCGSRSDISLDDAFAPPEVDASVPHDAAIRDAAVHDAALHDAEASAPFDAGVDAHPVPDSAPTCPATCDDDGIACTNDGCDPKTLACVHAPNDSRCPEGMKCDGVTGCVSVVYAVTGSALYEVTLPSGSLRQIASQLPFTSDVALTANSTLYVIGLDLASIDRVTGAVVQMTNLSAFDQFVGLEAASDGSLYASLSESDSIVRIDPTTGSTTPIATLPAGYMSSGDLAFINNRLYATAKTAFTVPADTLVEVGLNGATGRVIGSIGMPCVWGLATVGNTLYGFTCDGTMLTINTTTGMGTAVAKVGVSFNGAASR